MPKLRRAVELHNCREINICIKSSNFLGPCVIFGCAAVNMVRIITTVELHETAHSSIAFQERQCGIKILSLFISVFWFTYIRSL